MTIGGGTAEWLKAGVKRVSGIDLFAKGRELFWIRFPGCGKDSKRCARWRRRKESNPASPKRFR